MEGVVSTILQQSIVVLIKQNIKVFKMSHFLDLRIQMF